MIRTQKEVTFVFLLMEGKKTDMLLNKRDRFEVLICFCF